jgi:hypothetical protein
MSRINGIVIEEHMIKSVHDSIDMLDGVFFFGEALAKSWAMYLDLLRVVHPPKETDGIVEFIKIHDEYSKVFNKWFQHEFKYQTTDLILDTIAANIEGAAVEELYAYWQSQEEAI